MGNPLAQSRLAYLAGVIDGDGHLRMGVRKQQYRDKTYKIVVPSIEICNTNETIINYCRDILSENKIRFNHYINAKTGGKPYHCIILRSQTRCRKLLELVIPYLVEKKRRAQLIVDFSISRNHSSSEYTSKELAMVDEFNALKSDKGVAPSDINWDYLGGLFDAEGCISLTGGRKIKHNRISAIVPKVAISNTNKVLVDCFADAIKSLGINPHFYKSDKKNRRTFYEVGVANQAKAKKLLSRLIDHIVAKVGQARLVMDFISYRMSLAANGSPKKPYGDYELALRDKVMALNG